MLRRLSRGVGANAAGQAVLVVLQLVQVPVLASHWGLDLYGLWLMLVTVPSYLGFSDFGFGQAATVEMTMRVAVEDRPGALRIYRSATLLMAGIAAIMLTVLLAICFALPASVFGNAAPSEDARWALAFLICYGVVALGSSIYTGPLQSTGNYAVESASRAVMWGAEGTAVIVAVLLGATLPEAAFAFLAMRVLSLAGIVLVARRVAPWLTMGRRHASLEEIKRLARPAMAMMIMPLANACILQGTAMAVGLSASPAAVPAFTSTRTLSRVPMQLSGILVRATMPEFSAATARGDRATQIRLIIAAMWSSLALLAPVAGILLVGGTHIISIWTHGVVHPSAALVAVMACVLLANGFWVPLSNLVIATNRHATFSYYFLMLALASVGLALVLAKQLGALGGALAMLMTDAVMLVLLLSIVHRLFGPLGRIFAAMPETWTGMISLIRQMRATAN